MLQHNAYTAKPINFILSIKKTIIDQKNIPDNVQINSDEEQRRLEMKLFSG